MKGQVFELGELQSLVEEQKHILVWGPSMTGKTYSLWTLIMWLKEKKKGKLHLIDLDRKCESVVRKCEKEGILDYLKVVRYEALAGKIRPSEHVQRGEQFLNVMYDLNRYYDFISPTTARWMDTYTDAPGAIFIDSLTILNDMILDFVLNRAHHDLGEEKTDARRDFGRQMGKIVEVIRSLGALPCMTGCIAHEKQTEDEGRVRINPNVTGVLAPVIAREFSVVLRSEMEPQKDKTLYKWRLIPNREIQSAGSIGRDDLPALMDQDYRKVF